MKDWSLSIFDSSLQSVFSTSGVEALLTNYAFTDIDLNAAVMGRYVRFNVDSFYGFIGGLNELRVYESSDPIPSAVPAWLFGSALLGFFGFSRRKANA